MKGLRISPVADPSLNPRLQPSPQHAERDYSLLQKVRLRDEAAMADIFDHYSAMAYSIALRVLKDSAQAEDIIQDVFFQVWQSPETFAPDRGSFGAWLAVIVRNRSVDVIRRRRTSEAVDDVVLPANVDIASEVERNTVIERVRSVMKSLPIEQRETIELAFFNGLTHAEIAEKKGEPLGTIKTRIRSALTTLRKAFRS